MFLLLLDNITEEQRIASAYANYGPTTNNGLAELTAKEVTKTVPSESSTSASGGILQSSLEDGFKALYHNQMPSAYPRGYYGYNQQRYLGHTLQATTPEWTNPNPQMAPSSHKMTTGKPGQLLSLVTLDSSFIGLSSVSVEAIPPPPPGFTVQSRGPSVVPDRYSLWGNSNKEQQQTRGGNLMKLFQQSASKSNLL